MPYSVTTQDGYTLNGIPDELEPNSPQVLAEIEKLRVRNTAQQPPKTSAPRPYDIKEDDSNFVENILKGFGSGAAGMLESSALGIATLLEEEAELKARSKIKNIFDIDMLKGADQDSISYKLSSGIGSIAALAPAALAGPAALPVAGVIAGGAGAGEASERARAYGATESERNLAALKGTAIGLTEIAPLGRLAKGVSKGANKAFDMPKVDAGVNKVLDLLGPKAVTNINSRIRNVAGTGLLEGAQEGAAAILQNLTEQGYNPEQVLVDTGVLEEALIGGGAGAILQAVADAIGGRRSVRSGTGITDSPDPLAESPTDVELTEEQRTEQSNKKTADAAVAAKEKADQDAADAAGVRKEDLDAVAGVADPVVVKEDKEKKKLARAKKLAKSKINDSNAFRMLEEAALGTDVDVTTEIMARKENGATSKVAYEGIVALIERKKAERLGAAETETGTTERLDATETETTKVKQNDLTDTDKKRSGDSVSTDSQAPSETKVIATGAKEIDGGGVDSSKQGSTDPVNRKTGEQSSIERLYTLDKYGQVKAGAVNSEGVQLKDTDGKLTPAGREAQKLADIQKTDRDRALGKLGDRAQLSDRGALVDIDVRKRINQLTNTTLFPNTSEAGPVEPIKKAKMSADDAVTEVTKEIEALEVEVATQQAQRGREEKILDKAIVPTDTSSVETSAPADSNVTVDKSFVSRIGLTGDNKKFGDALLAKFGPDTGNPVTNKELAVSLRDTADIQDRYKLTYTKAPTEGQEKGKVVVVESYGTKASQTTAAKKAEEAGATDINTPVLSVVKLNKKAQAYVDTYAGKRAEPEVKASSFKMDDVRAKAILKKEGIDTGSEVGDTASKKALDPQLAVGEAATRVLEENAAIDAARGEALDPEAQAAADQAFVDQIEDVLGGANTFRDISRLPANYINTLDGLVSEKIQKLLSKGKLKESLIELAATSVDSRVKQIASVLAAAAGNTKIRTADGTDSFVSEDGTVNLADGPVYIHTLLHEATHSALNKKLSNPSHVATKKLAAIYKEVKPYLDSAYGATNLEEFVSEVMSNSEFQQKLAGMNTDGTSISVLSRVFRVITNFVRSLLGAATKTSGSALDAADQAIIQLLATSPETRGAGGTYDNATRDGVEKIVQELGLIQKGFPAPTPKFKEQFGKDGATWLDSVESIVTKLEALQLLDTQAVGDVAQARGFGDLGNRLHKMIQKMRGKQNQSDEYIKERVLIMSNWANKNPEKSKTMSELIYSQEFGATIHQVDPTITEKEAMERYTFDKKGEKSDKIEVWREQRKYWDALGKDGQAKYVYLRDTYSQQYNQLKRVVTGRMESVLSKEASDNLKVNVFDRMFDQNTLDVYFPLVRHGKYKLSYVPAETGQARDEHENYVVEMFETKDARIEAEAKAKVAGATKIKTSDGDITADQIRRNAPDVGFVSDVLNTLSSNNIEESVQNEIMNLFIDSLPETAFAKSLKGRSAIGGYEKDAIVAMRSKAFDIGRQTQRIDYAGRIRGISSEIKDVMGSLAINNTFKSGTTSAIGMEMMERADFAVNGAKDKRKEGVVKSINQVAFIYTIGFNASSALVNLSQLPLVVGPMLAAEFGHIKTGKAMTEAVAIVGSSNNDLLKYFDQSMDLESGEFTYALKKGLDPKIVAEYEPLTTLITMSAGRSYLTQSYLADAMGLDESTQVFGSAKEKLGLESSGRVNRGNVFSKALNSVSAVSAIMFNSGEKFNRQVTLVSAYKLSLEAIQTRERNKEEADRLSNEDIQREASEDALYKSMEYNGGAVLETGSRVSAEGYGRVAFMYKNYGLRMYTTMFKTGKQAIDLQFFPPKNETASQKEERIRQKKIAWGKLRAIHLSSLLVAGIQGMPLYGAVSIVMDLYLDDDEEDADTVVRKYFGEGWFKGPAVDALGVDFSKRVRLNSLLFEANRYSRSDSIEEDLFYHFGGPAFSTGKRMFRAGKDFSDGEIQRGIESALPAGLTNVLRNSPIGRYQQDEAMETRRGDVIYDDLTAGDFFSGMVGFPPTGYTFAQEQSNIEQGIDKAVGRERSRLLKQYYVARRQGDYPESKKVFEDMLSFSKKHPSARINYESLKRSYKGHQRTTAKMHNGTTLSPMMKRVLEEQRKEYDTSSLFD